MLEIAAQAARYGTDIRGYALGAAAVRADGTIVVARNGSAPHPAPAAHAEMRLLRKCDRSTHTVFVARVSARGELALARPCERCMAGLRARGIQRVVYSISTDEYGVVYIG